MRVTFSDLAHLLSGIGLSVTILAGGGCASGAAEATGEATAASAAGTVKFHVVLGEGPFKGTYDVASDACLGGVMKAGSWHATWEADDSGKDTLSSVLLSSSAAGIVTFVAAVSFLVLRSKMLPVWMAYVGLLAGALFLVGGVGSASDSGAFMVFGFIGCR